MSNTNHISNLEEARLYIEELEKKINQRAKIENEFKSAFIKSETRLRTIFEQSPFSIQICAPDGKTLLVNNAFKKLWNISDEFAENFILKEHNLLKDPLIEKSGMLPLITKAFQGNVMEIPAFEYDPNLNGHEGRKRHAEGIIYPLKDPSGTIKEIVIIHTDITDYHLHDKKKKFLSELAAILLTSLDYNKTLELLTEATLANFSDGCIVDIYDGKEVKRILTRHNDKKIEALMFELQNEFPPLMDSPQPTPRVIRSGKPELLKVVSQDVIAKRTLNSRHASLITSAGMKSHLAIPLIYRGETLGALNFWITSDRNPFDEEDIATAMDLGHYAAMAIDNARLFRDSQKSIKQREDFISIASHELKTPITSLKLQMEILNRSLGNPDPVVLKKVADATNRQLDRLTRLVEDMLDISRIANGKLLRDQKKINFSNLVFDVLERFGDQLTTFKIDLTFEKEEDVMVVCDPFRMEQVITNLMTNAIRYGERKPITVRLEKIDGFAHVSVKDAGVGIAPEDHQKIFNAFERATQGHEASGLGLGLFITSTIIKEHNGSIEVESSRGMGSTFTVKLKAI